MIRNAQDIIDDMRNIVKPRQQSWMTKEEAKERLLNHAQYKLNGEDLIALDMVIEAVEQEPCEDCVSRKAILNELHELRKNTPISDTKDFACNHMLTFTEKLPSVQPKPKTGHWIKTPKAVMGEGYMWYCDKCEYQVYQDSSKPYPDEKYCPNCGAKMESED